MTTIHLKNDQLNQTYVKCDLKTTLNGLTNIVCKGMIAAYLLKLT